eukprot:TRINITY_DN20907_c0_g1_i1.p1 TRINITY_DN20907_c0_g1~~TRINITY_DN20907_c0_g1_i1.p1  ORF type:complete len:194 (+),score=51.45 TRINITY_DN20907_c0_g1_i1:38-583(+)
MAELDIKNSAHCDREGCHMLDFLPFKCFGCNGRFCMDHFQYEEHECPTPLSKKPEKVVPEGSGLSVECPLCMQAVYCEKEESPDTVIGSHIAAGCPVIPAERRPEVVEAEREAQQAKKKKSLLPKKCCRARCKVRELVPMICSRCQKNFCVSHYHTNKHNCGATSQRRAKKSESDAVKCSA